MTFAELSGYPPGQLVTVFCRTTAANIYYKGAPDNGRHRFRPSDYQIRANHYTQKGRIISVSAGKYPYLKLEIDGDVAIFSQVAGTLKVIGYKRGKKIACVPISAICRRPKVHPVAE